MDSIDRRLLDLLQVSFPLAPRPFAVLGVQMGCSEDQVLALVRRLKDKGLIRQIGPIFDSQLLGYQSTLAAFRVEPDRLDHVALRISAHSGVSHNYARDHPYNLWFTLTLPNDQDMEGSVGQMAADSGVEDYLYLPALRIFKIGVHFDFAGTFAPFPRRISSHQAAPAPLRPFERDVVRATQGNLPLVARPFRPVAVELGVTEEELLDTLHEFARRGVMRRFGAVLRHRHAGFIANGMACWVVPEARVVEAGEAVIAFRQVSHCYQRLAFPPRWPYNLFTMVHGQERAEVKEVAERIRQSIQPLGHTILYSVKEYKKERVRYFEEDEEA